MTLLNFTFASQLKNSQFSISETEFYHAELDKLSWQAENLSAEPLNQLTFESSLVEACTTEGEVATS